jgi:pimeloyl-ACP methyl ester carboxylesterase
MPATIILVHGACHGPWCWDAVRSLVTERELRSVAVALPSCGEDPQHLGTPADDVLAVRAAIAEVDGPVLLVGHSLGGMAISAAATGCRQVRHLLYLAAFMLDEGETTAEATREQPAGDWIISADGLSASAADPFRLSYKDCPASVAASAIARLRPQNPLAAVTPLASAAWRLIPTTYVICRRDRAIPASLQTAWARGADRVL